MRLDFSLTTLNCSARLIVKAKKIMALTLGVIVTKITTVKYEARPVLSPLNSLNCSVKLVFHETKCFIALTHGVNAMNIYNCRLRGKLKLSLLLGTV